jgi:hypothetical protein
MLPPTSIDVNWTKGQSRHARIEYGHRHGATPGIQNDPDEGRATFFPSGLSCKARTRRSDGVVCCSASAPISAGLRLAGSSRLSTAR